VIYKVNLNYPKALAQAVIFDFALTENADANRGPDEETSLSSRPAATGGVKFLRTAREKLS
jgi:hypothetical protein